MKKRISLLAAAISVVFVCNVYASPKADKCPSVSALQSVGLVQVNKFTNGAGETAWYGFQPRSTYDTEQEWTFTDGPFNDEQAEVALKKATESLATLSLFYGPADVDGSWLCIYTDPTHTIIGGAVTPPRDFPSQLISFMKK